MASENHLPAMISGLMRPEAYPHPADHVQLHETHVSWVILAGEYAYKLKKPVKLGFVDFSTFVRRAANAEREVALNRRLAPSMYLGVVDVVERDGEVFAFGTGRVLERAVRMRRLPTEGMLSRLLARDAVSPGLIRRIARMVANFHKVAPTGPGVDEYGARSNVEAHWRGNFEEIQPYVDVTIPSWELAAVRASIERTLDQQRDLLDRRIAEGRIRDGHGDLHADSLCLVDDEIVAFDCIEFNDAYRCGDVAAEVAFLAMDLDHLGRADLGWTFVTEYVHRAEDPGVLALLDFYKCYRAFVRGKVISIRLAEPSLPEAERAAIAAQARSYFDLALVYAGGVPRPMVITTSGLPGTGKTTLAEALARRLGMVHVPTDIVRKRLAGMEPTDHSRAGSEEGLYSAEMTRRTYAAVRAAGARWLRRGVSVVLDGTFTEPRQRDLVRRLARRLDVPLILVVTTTDDETIRGRLEARESDPTNASDATWAVYQDLRRRYPIPKDLPSADLLIDETGGAGADAVIHHLASTPSGRGLG